MANITIPNLPVAVTLAGDEQLEIVQPPGSADGVSKRTTVQAIANLAPSNISLPLNIGSTANVTGVLNVPNGGSGTSNLTANGVLLGNGTGAFSTVDPATATYVLTANGTSSPPTFQAAGGLSNQPGLSALGVTGNATASPAAITGTTNQVLRVEPNGTALSFGQVNLSATAAVTGILAVLLGGIGTSALTANSLLVGNGTAAVSVVANATANYVLTSNGTASAPTFQASTSLSSIAGPSVLGVSGTASAIPGAITGASANQVLRVGTDGTTLAFGQVNLSSTSAVTGSLASSSVAGIISVPNGGTGTSALTAGGLLAGNGTSAVTIVTAGSAGQVLVGQTTTSNPSFQTVTGDLTMNLSGSAVIANNAVTYAKFQTVAALSVVGNGSSATTNAAAITGTANQALLVNAAGTGLAFGLIPVSASITGIVPVANGGSGTSALTAFGVVLGNGTSAVTIATAGSAGQILVGQTTTSQPIFKTVVGDLTVNLNASAVIANGAVTYAKIQNVGALSVFGNGSSASTVGADLTGTANQVLRVNSAGTGLAFGQVNLATATGVTGVLPVGNGGSGTSAITAHGLIVGNGTSTVTILAVGTDGQIVVGQSSADPAWKTMSGDVTINNVGTATIANNAVTYAKFQTVAGLSVVGNTSSATTNAAAITGTTDQVLVVNSGGTAVVFGKVNLGAAAAISGSLTSANIATSAFMMLATTGQAYSGGVTLTSLSLGTAAATTTTLVAGNPPLQRIIINGTAAFVAPSSECEIDILVTNAASASTISFSGFSVGSNTGDTYTTTNGSKFILMSRTINGSSTYAWKALQ